MTLSKNFPVANQQITIIINRNTPNELHFKSVVSDIKDEARLEIILPDNIDNKTFDVAFPVEIEYSKNNALFQYKTKVADINLDENGEKRICSIYIDENDEPTKIQRRSFFRLPTNIPVKIKKIKIPENFEDDKSLQESCMAQWKSNTKPSEETVNTYNIGGGGLGFQFHMALNPGDDYFFEFKIESSQFAVPGQITYCQKVKNEDIDSFLIGVRFVALNEKDQDKIVEYVFKEQNKILRAKS